jgi:NCAIR mutase (PurE)-related proteins
MAPSRNILIPLLEKAGGKRRFSPGAGKRLFSPLVIVSRGAATGGGTSAPAGGIATDAINGGSAAIFEILENIEKGALSPTDAENKLRQFWKASTSAVESSRGTPPPDETLKSFANLDHRRSLRAGFPEVRPDFAFPYFTYVYISINNINLLTCVVGYFFIRKDS